MKDVEGIFRSAPLLKITLAFITGICIQSYFHISLYIWITSIIFSLSAFIIIEWLWKHPSYLKTYSHACCLVLLISLGAVRLALSDITNKQYEIEDIYNYNMQWQGVITSSEVRSNYHRYIVELEKLINDNQEIQVHTNVIIYDFSNKGLLPGEKIISNSTLNYIQTKNNPGEFDIQQFYQRQGIFYQTFIQSSNDIKTIAYQSPIIVSVKNKIKQSIEQHLSSMLDGDTSSIAIADALILGKEVRYPINEQVIDIFRKTGIIHILVVSGFQVATLAWIVSWLLGLVVGRIKKGKLIVCAISLIFIWVFIYLVGMDVSIMRAGIIFSFIQINTIAGGGKQNPFQVLALSALIILMITPYELWSLGFIFSFLALTGIFMIAPHINKKVKSMKDEVSRYILNSLLISFAASIFTIPVTAFIFGKFYTYFFVADLIAIPISMCILVLSCIGIVFSFINLLIPSISILVFSIGKVIIFLVNTMYFLIHYLSKLPYATLDFKITQLETILICMGCFLCIYAVKYNSYKYLFNLGLICILTVFVLHICYKINHKNQQFICALNWNTAVIPILLVEGEKATFFTPSSLDNKVKQTKRLLASCKLAFNIKAIERQLIDTKTTHHIFKAKQQNILYIHRPLVQDTLDINQANILILNFPTYLQKHFFRKYNPYITTQEIITTNQLTTQLYGQKINALQSEGAVIIQVK